MKNNGNGKNVETRNNYLYDDCGVEIKDEFNIHTSIIDTLFNQINKMHNKKSSFAFGIFGEWGSGKSFIINKLKDKLEKARQTCFIIDVWKYNGQSLLRAILFELVKQSKGILCSNVHKSLEEDIEQALYSQTSKSVKIKKPLWLKISFSAFILLLSVFIFVLSSDTNLIIDLLVKWGTTALFASSIIGFALYVFNISLAKMAKIMESNSDEKISKVQAFSPEQFEKHFNEIINEISKKKGKDAKIVIVFDNVDRCQPKFAYETLSCIKTYLDKKECIYLIPCDDIAIKQHINNSKSGERNFADEFLDKIFQTSFRIPKLKVIDTDAYIGNLFTSIDIEGLDNDDYNSIRKILYFAYKGETPRQIKKFINDFITYYYIALDVDENKEFILDDISMFTIMICIKQKFLEYENRMLENSEYMRIFYYGRFTKPIKDFKDDNLIIEYQQQTITIGKDLNFFLRNVYDEINQEKPLRCYIYFKKTDNELEIYNNLRDGTTVIDSINAENIKWINDFFWARKYLQYEMNVQKSILNYFIDNYKKASDEINNLTNTKDKNRFFLNVSNLIKKITNEATKKDKLKAQGYISELRKDQLIEFTKVLRLIKYPRFMTEEILSNLFTYDKNYKEIFELLLGESINGEMCTKEDIIEYLDNLDIDEFRNGIEDGTQKYNKFQHILTIIIKDKRFEVISNNFAELIINTVDEIDLEIIQHIEIIIENKPDIIDCLNNRITVLSEKKFQYLSSQALINNNIEKLDYIFKLYYISSLDSTHERWTYFEKLLLQLINFNITQDNYLSESLKILLINDSNIAPSIIRLQDNLIKYLVHSRDNKTLDVIMSKESIWPSINKNLRNYLLTTMDIIWIGKRFDSFFKVPLIKIYIDSLLENYKSTENKEICEEFKNMTSSVISRMCLDSLIKHTNTSNISQMEIVKDIVKSIFEVSLHKPEIFKELGSKINDIIEKSVKIGFELSTILSKNNIFQKIEIVMILENFRNNYLNSNKTIEIDSIKKFINSINLYKYIVDELTNFCYTLFATGKKGEYYKLGDFIYRRLLEHGKLKPELRLFMKNCLEGAYTE